MQRNKLFALAIVGVIALLTLNAFVPTTNAFITQQNMNSASGTSTTRTCTLARPAQGDISFVVITSTQSVSSVADSASNTYTNRASVSLATGTTGAYVYFYLANVTAGYGAPLTITVTFSSAAYNGVECMDIVGLNVHPDHTSTGTGTLSSSTSFYVCATVGGVNVYCTNHQGLSVTSFQPALGDFVVSGLAAYGCNTNTFASGFIQAPPDDDFIAGDFGSPFYPTFQWNTGYPTIQTATGCGGSNFYQFFGGGAYKKLWPSGSTPTIQNYSGTSMPNQISGSNTANFVVLAASFPQASVSSFSQTETVSLAPSVQKNDISPSQTLGLQVNHQTPQVSKSEALGLFGTLQPAQVTGSGTLCMGIKINLTDGSYVVNTGAICGAPIVAGATLTIACNFFQFQCWAIPLMYLGMIDGFFLGVAGAFRVSEKSAMYLIIAGLTWGSLVEISLGIMTPMLPVILIAMNVAYSFRLDKVVTQLVAQR